MNSNSSPFIYNGKFKIITQSQNEDYKDIQNLLNTYFEINEFELCGHPYIRPYINEKDTLFFSIPFDNNCLLQQFEKECIKLSNLIENLGSFKIESGYVNAIQIFNIEDPIQYKYIIRRKEDKLTLSKVSYDRNIYSKMKYYLKKSTKENNDFYNSIDPK